MIDHHHLQLEVDRLTTVVDAQSRLIEAYHDILRAAEHLTQALDDTSKLVPETRDGRPPILYVARTEIHAAYLNLVDALKAFHHPNGANP